MFWLAIQRLATLGSICLFSLIVIGASSNYIAIELTQVLSIDGVQVLPVQTPDALALLNVAVAAITILTVPPMIVVDILRRGAFTSMVLVELSWLGFLSILWIAAAGFTVDSLANALALCDEPGNANVTVAQSICTDGRVSAAFGFLAWLALLGYTVTLLVMSIITHQKGFPVWKSTVKDGKFITSAPKKPASKISGGTYYLSSESIPMKHDVDSMMMHHGNPSQLYPPSSAPVPTQPYASPQGTYVPAQTPPSVFGQPTSQAAPSQGFIQYAGGAGPGEAASYYAGGRAQV